MADSPPWKTRLHNIIFEADTPAGKAFDVVLLVLILLSVVVVMLDSVAAYRAAYGPWFYAIEWTLTAAFTVEYIARILCVRRPTQYVFSFFGWIDLLSLLPTYLSLFIAGSQSLLVIRSLRLVRMFRVLKLARYVGEANVLRSALLASRAKISVFLLVVLSSVIIVGTLMYLVEGPENGFTSIPKSVYWAVVTMTTVGYGDITPRTVPGQVLSTLVMILGYGIIAVPTGIVSVALAEEKARISTRTCPSCAREGHLTDAKYCDRCGELLHP